MADEIAADIGCGRQVRDALLYAGITLLASAHLKLSLHLASDSVLYSQRNQLQLQHCMCREPC